ncbi:hypothetical protein TNCV_4886911 [Trichonephila clavipes]|uniref:Uncharacterized protein n=1 Tax=Trichonephila clavipes TaxID=2585209 RepID=A0A8X6RJJ6_TRICX|nr:hypothetical protein TNCV_4886911 [Trichonephila clavipes]
MDFYTKKKNLKLYKEILDVVSDITRLAVSDRRPRIHCGNELDLSLLLEAALTTTEVERAERNSRSDSGVDVPLGLRDAGS